VSAARDVVVVGGGPAGVASALILRQRGHDVLLLDRARFPRDKVCGESVSPGAWPILERLALADAVRRLEPQPIRGMTLVAPDATRFSGSYPDGGLGFAVRRERLDACLLDAARGRGVEVHEAARVVGIQRADGFSRLFFEDEAGDRRATAARLVVAADGRQGVIAESLGLRAPHPRLRRFALRCHFDGVDGLSERGEMHVVPGAYCGIAPLGQRAANVALVLDEGEMAAAGGDVAAFFARALGRWPEIQERLSRARPLGPPRATGPLAVAARRVSAPGVLLVGDAAGFFDPFTGEGITLALRSAELMAPVADLALRSGRLHDLSRYDRERDAATRDKFLVNRLIQRLLAWPALASQVARRLRRRPGLADRLVGIAGDLVPARDALGAGFLLELLAA
jgi:geranylgeranyl reductase family protein